MKTSSTLNLSLHELDIYNQNLDNFGLLNGKMGLCINLYEISKESGNAVLRNKADNLLDEIFTSINTIKSTSFFDGLSGIGWGIMHLISNEFITGNIDDILSDIDNLLIKQWFQNKVISFDLFTGLLGYTIYFTERVKTTNLTEINLELLIIKQAMIGMVDNLFPLTDSNRNLTKEPDSFTRYRELVVALNLFQEIYSLNLYNSKVGKITNLLLQSAFDNLPLKHVFKLQLSVTIRKLEFLSRDTQAESLSIFLKNIDRSNIIHEFNSCEDNRTRYYIEVLKLYKSLITYDDSKHLFEELDFWRVEVNENIEKSFYNISCNQDRMQIIQKIGLFDGFNGFYKIAPLINLF